MKAITLWQPWASLWLSPRKVHETRHYRTTHRGPLLVHASKRFEKDHPTELATILRDQFGADWFKTLPTGAVIGVVNVVDVLPTEDIRAKLFKSADDLLCGNFADGRFGWARREFQALATPIPYRGLQAMFSVPDELLPFGGRDPFA